MTTQEYDEGLGSEASTQRVDDAAENVAVTEQPSPSAARLLEMTARETDQWRSDAQAQAARIVAAAREEASALVQSAQREAASLVQTARLEAARMVDGAQTLAEDVREQAAKQRAKEEIEVARLRQLAADHAHHLRTHLNEVLDRLDVVPSQQEQDGVDDS